MATRDELLRLHDGELSTEEAERVRARLSPEDRLRLDAMREVGDAVRSQVDRPTGEVDLWNAIQGRLDAEPADLLALRRRRRVLYGAAGLTSALLAAAAALLLWLPQPPPLKGPAVESVDFGQEAGILFQIHDTPTTVLWQ